MIDSPSLLIMTKGGKRNQFSREKKKQKSRVVWGFCNGPDKRTKSVGVIRVSLLEKEKRD